MAENEEIREAITEEKSRGRKQPHAAAMRRRILRLAAMWPELQKENEQGFRQKLKRLGFEENSPEWKRVYELWRGGWKP